jgi:hypothetical protein
MIRKLAALTLSVAATAVVLAGPASARVVSGPHKATPAISWTAVSGNGVCRQPACPFPRHEPPHFTWDWNSYRWVPWSK